MFANQERLLRAEVLPRIGTLELRKVKRAHCRTVVDEYEDGHAQATVGQLKAALSVFSPPRSRTS